MNNRHFIKVHVTLLMITVICTVLLPRAAFCRLSGDLELGYVNYDSRTTGQNLSAHSLSQRYSILYEKSDSLVNGRLGRYHVALGYDWLTFDSSVKSSTTSAVNYGEARGHINYRGDVLLNPKEIPFKLRLYSHDLNRGTFTESGILGNSASSANVLGYSPVASGITSGVYNGMRLESGATLVMGVKNGMTNGYNEILRHFPMLMLDYKDYIEKDMSGFSRVDNHLSRLAFISLNKKDNWFHYRYITFVDRIDDNNNYNETQFQLGTVDHVLQRRWIDFSNWLSVSADGQFTKRVQAKAGENYEEFSLNLFGAARRQSWELRTFTNFTRMNEININRITYMTSLPLYFNGTISPTSVWSAYAKYNENRIATGGSFVDINGGYTIDTFRKSQFTLSHGLNIEHVTNTGSNSENLIMSGTVNTSSTPKFSRDALLKAAYDIKSYFGSSNGTSSLFIDHGFSGVASYSMTSQFRIKAAQKNRFSSGTAQVISSSIPGAEISSAQYQAPRSGTVNGNRSSYQSFTEVAIEWKPKPRLMAAISASEDIYAPESGEHSAIFKTEATLTYADSRLNLSSKFTFANGDIGNSENRGYFSSTNSASYIFNRRFDAKADFSYSKTLNSNTSAAISAGQSLNYKYSNGSGVAGSLFEINESFSSVEEIVEKSNRTRRLNTFMLGAKYFPLRQLMVAGGAKYFFVNSGEGDGLNYYGSLSMQFKLLTASADYTYGKTKVDNRVEKRVTANLKKRF